MEDWLLFLGAGASVASPTRRPLFLALAAGVLRALGWRPGELEGQKAWIHSRYPPFSDPDLSAEVLFGALRRFGVQFTDQLAGVFADADPNAVHQVAASALAAGGCVWTTNVDTAIEAACHERGLQPPLAGRAADRAPELLRPLKQAAPGTLVKLHGSAAVPETMAFTDRELIAPLPADDLEHLAALAHDRTVVIFGYAGADADLADLLDEVFLRATRVIWHEPFHRAQAEITRAFRRKELIDFRPHVTAENPVDLEGNARLFMELAQHAGAHISSAAADAFLQIAPPPGPPELRLDAPGIAQARLVERFGAPDTHADALRAARVEDVLGRRRDTLYAHFRWTVSDSLYHAGFVARIVGWLADHPNVLARLQPPGLRDYLITRASALRLRNDGWDALGQFADWAISVRSRLDGTPYPTDLYYRAQARRYELRPAAARADADAAVTGLSDAALSDPERLAGALLESGMAAIYTGRFPDALDRGFDLQFRRGRYAIQVWRGWGAWLQTIAFCHLRDPDAAGRELQEVQRRFEADGRPGLLNDLRTSRLLRHRVEIAAGAPADEELIEEARRAEASGRYRDDLDLILADLAIAVGALDDARQRLTRIERDPASPIGAAMAELGLAELAHLSADADRAIERFAKLAQHCREREVTWLETQALLGLHLCGDEQAQQRFDQIRTTLPAAVAPGGSLASVAFGEPRVLWLLTV